MVWWQGITRGGSYLSLINHRHVLYFPASSYIQLELFVPFVHDKQHHWGPFCQHGLALVLAWTDNYIHNEG